MAKTFRPQFSFTTGQIDSDLEQRGDLEVYYKGLSKAENCLCKTTGGITRRYGTKFIDYAPKDQTKETLSSGSFTIPNLSTGSAANLIDSSTSTTVVTTTVSSSDFVIFSYDLGSSNDVGYISLLDVVLSGGTATSPNELVFQISSNGSDWTNILPGSALYYATTTAHNWTYKIDSSTQYFRLISTASFDAAISLSQVEVYTNSGNLSAYRIIDFTSRVSNIDTNKIIVFGEQFADVFNSETGTRLNSFYSGKSASFMQKCDYETDIDGRLLFAESTATPFEIISSGGSATEPSYYTVQDISLENIPKYEFVPNDETNAAWGTLTPSATTGYVTLTASSGTPFSGASTGWKVSLSPVGRVRITQIVSNTVVKGFVEQKIQDTSAVAASSWTIEKGWEDIISSTRGWPRTLSFHEGRLYFAGTNSLPDLIMASTIEDNYDFDIADQSDSDGFWRQLGAKRSANIYILQSRNTLEIYCNGGVYIISTSGAITPTNIKTNRVTPTGISEYIEAPTIADGGSLYINNNKNGIYWMIYTDDKLSYQSKLISELSSSLVSLPSSESKFNVKVWDGDSTFRNNFLCYIDEDYNLIFSSLLLEEKVKAFSKCILNERDSSGTISEAKVKYICPSGSKVWAIVEFPERDTVETLQFNSSYLLDASLTATVSSDAVSGLDRFEGMYVDVILSDSGEYLGSFAVSSGAIDLGETTYDGETVEVGSAFYADIETMPIEDIQNIGSSIGKYKNISEIYINPESISNLYINGNYIMDYSNSNAVTESFVNRTLYGWSRSKNVRLSQEKPLDFSIKNILMKAEVNN